MQNLPGDLVVVLGASVFLLLISLFIVFLLMAYKRRDKSHLNEKKKLEESFRSQLLQSQIEVQEQTFQQIAKELHDNVGQLLSTSRMLIGLTERSLTAPPDTLLTANATIGQAINELRMLSKSLDKDWLEQFDFFQNLQTEVNRINACKEVNVTLHAHQPAYLPAAQRIILFRLVQEALQNALKHSKCSNINIVITKNNKALRIVVQDDGKGFDMPTHPRGMGLVNMQQRAGALKARLEFRRAETGGTNVILEIPEIPTS